MVQYRDGNGSVIRTKRNDVEYSWKPTKCEHCKVFGHSFGQCKVRPRTEEEVKIAREEANKNTYEGAKVVQNRGNGNNNIQVKARVQGMEGWNKFDKGNMNNRDVGWNKFDKGKSKEVYRPKSMYEQNGNDVNNKSNAGMNKSGQNGNNVKGSTSNKSTQNRNGNKFATLESLGESSENEISVTQKKEVEF